MASFGTNLVCPGVTMKIRLTAGVIAGVALLATGGAQAAGLIVSGDEFTLSDGGYGSGTKALVDDIAGHFGGTNYLILTGDPFVGGDLTDFVAELGTLGKTVTEASALPGSLSGYDAVFHFGQFLTDGQRAEITAFAAGGGASYISLGGAAYGDAQGEADAWNPYIEPFGLTAGSTWFPCACHTSILIDAAPNGVTGLDWGNGQSIDPTGAHGASYVTGHFSDESGEPVHSLIGISDGTGGADGVPEPATWGLLIAGFAAVGARLRRRSTVIA
jgi:hypothetical protein